MSEFEWMDIFGDNLVSLLEHANMSQKDLADLSGIPESSISRYINKKAMPNLKAIINMAYALDQDITEFIDFEEIIE